MTCGFDGGEVEVEGGVQQQHVALNHVIHHACDADARALAPAQAACRVSACDV